ncbi:MAG TPA: WavE lipopolysaccharide synthesis [Pantoea sp.]|nr:WavE lipopolysaccharide synthesis [Pantoea sp.]
MNESLNATNFFNFAIILQGPITNGDVIDKKVIRNVIKTRKLFPISKIIVSCWDTNEKNKSALKNIARYYNFDIIYNVDPGCIVTYVRGAKLVCNLNRMIVSTINALNIIDDKYVIKIRSDSYFSTDKIKDFLRGFYFNKSFPLLRDARYTVFEERVINGDLFARDPNGYLPYLFHPGDILLAGLTSDLIKLFDVPLAKGDIFSVSRRCYFYSMMRFVPEQYIWVNCIKNVTNQYPFLGNSYFSNELVVLSENYYVNNFYLVESKEMDFHWPKHSTHYNNKGRFSLYNKADWGELYSKYIMKERNHPPFNHKKKLITKVMIVYFTIRTIILRFPYVRMLAIKLFSNRG